MLTKREVHWLASAVLGATAAIACVGNGDSSNRAMEELSNSTNSREAGTPTGGLPVLVLAENACTGNSGPEPGSAVFYDSEALSADFDVVARKGDPSAQAPSVDFEEAVVVAVYRGLGSCGTTWSVQANEGTSTVDISVAESVPGEGCSVNGAISYPYLYLKLPKIDKDYEVAIQQTAVPCATEE